jgi:hypothetical protein
MAARWGSGRSRLAGALLLTLFAGPALIPLLASPAGAGSTLCSSSAGKCYSLAITASPTTGGYDTAYAGTLTTFSFTFTNEAGTQTLGSVKITAPTGFQIDPALTSTPTGSVTAGSSSALFTNLGVAPGGSIALTVTATTPCAGGAYAWGLVVKQSNDFSGPPGNDFSGPTSANAADVTVSANGTGCQLEFASQPAGTTINTNITSAFDNPAGAPVVVQVVNSNGQDAIGASVPVTIQYYNTMTDTLSGSVTVDTNPATGAATFSNDLSLGTAVVGDELYATSPGMTGAASCTAPSVGAGYCLSAPFTIYDTLQNCVNNQCASGTLSGNKTTGSASGTGLDSLYLGLGFLGTQVQYSCAGYTAVSDTLEFQILGSNGIPQNSDNAVVTLEIDKSLVKPSPNGPGVSAWQVCYASPNKWNGYTQTENSLYVGLLPDCASSAGPAPCILAKNKDNAGDIVLTVLSTGDPVFRG